MDTSCSYCAGVQVLWTTELSSVCPTATIGSEPPGAGFEHKRHRLLHGNLPGTVPSSSGRSNPHVDHEESGVSILKLHVGWLRLREAEQVGPGHTAKSRTQTCGPKVVCFSASNLFTCLGLHRCGMCSGGIQPRIHVWVKAQAGLRPGSVAP